MSFAVKPQQPSQHTSISKSTVLAGAGLQDAYWSDDEDEDAECPLCLEEMDVAEMGFKPCPCGYQICMFCYHHIKSNLNGRCPACRREYLEENVEFTAVAKEDLKKQAQQKKRKERERKELEALGRRQFANVRVAQRNVVYVVGLGPRFAKEELIPALRSNEFFGQYGKISKIIISKRHLPGSKSSVVGVYVTYLRREDATKAIIALDGSPSPAGGSEVLRASYGTTKYCMSFLRGLNCSNNACVDLHEWGDKNDCFTKEDLTTLKHTLKDSETQSRTTIRKKPDELEASPGVRNASWIPKPNASNAQSLPSRPPRLTSVRGRNSHTNRPPVAEQSRSGQRSHDRRPPGPSYNSSVTNTSAKAAAGPPAQNTSSPPPSPKVPSVSPPEQPSSPTLPAVTRTRVTEPPPQTSTPTSPIAPDLEVESSMDPDSQITLSSPPGLPHPVYQISTPAQLLLDDARARRDVPLTSSNPFPEFDRTLENLGRTDYNFSWTMDANLTPSVNNDMSDEYRGSFDPFSGPPPISGSTQSNERRFPQLSAPPGLMPSPRTPQTSVQSVGGYRGLFNPFADMDSELTLQPNDSRDGSRQESRFDFARRKASPSINGSPKFSAFASSSPPSDLSSSLARQQFGMPWPLHGQTPRSSFNSPSLYSTPPPGVTYEYPPNPSILNVSSPVTELRREQQPAFPPGLNFQPFDHTDERTRPLTQPDRTSQNPNFPMSSGLTSVNMPHISNIMSPIPPGFSPRQHTSLSSPIFSESIQSPSALPQSVLQSNHRTSISSTPANGEFTLDFHGGRVSRVQYRAVHSQYAANIESNRKLQYEMAASPHLPFEMSWEPSAPMPDPVLLPEDFPALPSSTVSDANIKKETQPHITVKESKNLHQLVIPARKVPSKSLIKDAKPQIMQSEPTIIKYPAAPTTPTTPSTPTIPTDPPRLHKVIKSRKIKDEKAEELKDDPTLVSESGASKVTENKDTRKVTKVSKSAIPAPPLAPEPVQAPMFSKVAKKSKPKEPRLPRVPKENREEAKIIAVETSRDESTGTATPKSTVAEVSSTVSAQVTSPVGDVSSITALIEQIIRKGFDLSSLAFFNPKSIEADSHTPLQYDPLVHALSALSVGGGSFANNLPPVSIDSAVSSFQQLLETLTQTISDLLRLLPRATWDDSSSFDSVLRDMLKGDDFLDDAGDENGKDDEVAALTLALEKRARWMEVQLAKLEELHRDINMAAVRAILTVNDRGWDPCGFMHRSNAGPVSNGSSLTRFDNLNMIQGKGKMVRRMTTDELQKAADKAQQEEKLARQAVLDSMARIADYFPVDYDD